MPKTPKARGPAIIMQLFPNIFSLLGAMNVRLHFKYKIHESLAKDSQNIGRLNTRLFEIFIYVDFDI